MTTPTDITELERLAKAATPGYMIVPVEPTEEMLDRAVAFALNVGLHYGYGWSSYMRDVWGRMLSATPAATVKQSLTYESDKEAARDAALEEAAGAIGGTGMTSVHAAKTIRALKSQPAQPSDSRTEFSGAEILDWMIENNGLVERRGNQYYCGYGPYGTVLNGTLADSPREAIIAAMRAEREGL